MQLAYLLRERLEISSDLAFMLLHFVTGNTSTDEWLVRLVDQFLVVLWFVTTETNFGAGLISGVNLST